MGFGRLGLRTEKHDVLCNQNAQLCTCMHLYAPPTISQDDIMDQDKGAEGIKKQRGITQEKENLP